MIFKNTILATSVRQKPFSKFSHVAHMRLKTMCGSRTGGWSLPGEMSDRQCCVD
jgi:hypothetical protein